ncbi:MAG TPA: hypothetical protein VN711_02170 [Candidatus Saccharimonadales bacterium]|nr:hypothetical protein [Candidatus Saccharimonadales bacterium]
MKEFFRSVQQDAVGAWSFWVTTLLFVTILCGIAVLYRSLPPYLPLYNHMPWGYSRLGVSYEIFVPLGTAIIFVVVNTFLGKYLRSSYPLLARFLFAANASLAFFTLIFFLRLAQIIL